MLGMLLFDGGITNPTLNIGRTFLDGGLQIHWNVKITVPVDLQSTV